MGFDNSLAGAVLTVAMPLGLLGAVVLWGFFERRPGRRFGGIAKSAGPELVGRPQVHVVDTGAESGGGPVEGRLG